MIRGRWRPPRIFVPKTSTCKSAQLQVCLSLVTCVRQCNPCSSAFGSLRSAPRRQDIINRGSAEPRWTWCHLIQPSGNNWKCCLNTRVPCCGCFHFPLLLLHHYHPHSISSLILRLKHVCPTSSCGSGCRQSSRHRRYDVGLDSGTEWAILRLPPARRITRSPQWFGDNCDSQLQIF
jgi:hypothetical protein